MKFGSAGGISVKGGGTPNTRTKKPLDFILSHWIPLDKRKRKKPAIRKESELFYILPDATGLCLGGDAGT